MAFRVHPFEFPRLAEGAGASDLPCELVTLQEKYDVVFFWLVEDQPEFWLAASLLWIGGLALGDSAQDVWVGMSPSMHDGPIARAIGVAKRARVVFSGGPIDALATLLRQQFIGVPYAEYLQTRHWQEVREAALKAADYRCQVCYSPDRLNVHHRTYERRGRELPSDVTVLCADCHGRFHDKLPKGGE
jgi:hypothetical protein